MAFKVKMKVYTGKDGREYLVSHVPPQRKPRGLRLSQMTVKVFVMRDDDTQQVKMTMAEYNELPYRWFEEAGPAPHPSEWEP